MACSTLLSVSTVCGSSSLLIRTQAMCIPGHICASLTVHCLQPTSICQGLQCKKTFSAFLWLHRVAQSQNYLAFTLSPSRVTGSNSQPLPREGQGTGLVEEEQCAVSSFLTTVMSSYPMYLLRSCSTAAAERARRCSALGRAEFGLRAGRVCRGHEY